MTARLSQQARCMEAAFTVAQISRDYRVDMPAEQRAALDREWLAAETDPRWKGNDAETATRAAREWEAGE